MNYYSLTALSLSLSLSRRPEDIKMFELEYGKLNQTGSNLSRPTKKKVDQQ